MVKSRQHRYTCVWLAVCLAWSVRALPQSAQNGKRPPDNIIFYQLGTTQGLSSANTNTMCTDQNGNLWVGTPDGLNRFNGKTVVNFFSRNNTGLQNDNIQELVCDDANLIWIRSAGGYITLLDANRKFHRVTITENQVRVPVLRILKTKDPGIILFTEKGFYVYKKSIPVPADTLGTAAFDQLNISPLNEMAAGQFTQIEPFGSHSYIFYNNHSIYIADFKRKQVISTFIFPGVQLLLHWKAGEWLVYDPKDALVKSLAFSTGRFSYPFAGITDQYGKPLPPRIQTADTIDKNRILFTSLRDGLYLFDKSSGSLTRYIHRPGDETTILNNRPRVICKSNNGWVFVGSRLSGISYFKTDLVVGRLSFFSDGQGNSYDGYTNHIVSRDNINFYIGTGYNLIKWNRYLNTSSFINYAHFDGRPVNNEEGAANLAFDARGHLWFITSTRGIMVLDKNDRLLKQLPMDTSSPGGLHATWAEHITKGADGWMWIATNRGIRRVHPVSFEIQDMITAGFNELQSVSCNHIYFDKQNTIWLSTFTKGLWCYTMATKKLRRYIPGNGGISNQYLIVTGDTTGTIYAGSDKGMQILWPDGSTKTIAQPQGLPGNLVDILMTDSKNRIWIGNNTGIACYNPADQSLRYFNETYGLGTHRLRSGAIFTQNGEDLFWATEKGIQYFNPDKLCHYQPNFKPAISRIEATGFIADVSGNASFRLDAGDNDVTFHFNTNDYVTGSQTFYQYKLEGQDKDWHALLNQHSIRYSALTPGRYVFTLKASNDGSSWTDAENKVVILISPPFFKTVWFRLAALAFITGLIFIFLRMRERRIREKEAANTAMHKIKAENYRLQLETEQITGFFTSTIHQHENVNDMLWDVAKNLIGKLGFEECMIYLWNEDKTLLVQQAGYGLKGSMDLEKDKNRYNLKKGQGIIGAAVESKQPQLVNNTLQDQRYYSVDGKIMWSELCVPIMNGQEVIGAVNTENSLKNFYTERHLQLLTTIASLLSGKINTLQAKEQTRQKEMEVLKLQKDLATSQLTALRAQMNPHFIFNALNSVQQYMLQGNVTEANRYLSRFSRLQREILQNSDQNLIPLEKELDMLRLYLELEQLRLSDQFSYAVSTSEETDEDEMRIPTMIVQPFVENAIWHGLATKTGERYVHIHFSLKDEDNLICTIRDNGIGREAAGRLSKENGTHTQHQSKGMLLVYERLRILEQQYKHKFTASITDLKDEQGLPAGTLVTLIIYTGN